MTFFLGGAKFLLIFENWFDNYILQLPFDNKSFPFEKSAAMKMSSTQGPHSLAFRVMRLCRPSLHVEIPVRFDPSDLLFGEDLFDDPVAASHLPRLLADTVSDGTTTSAADPSDLSYRNRFLLQHPSDSLGLPGLLLLPQSFGFASFCFLYLKC